MTRGSTPLAKSNKPLFLSLLRHVVVACCSGLLLQGSRLSNSYTLGMAIARTSHIYYDEQALQVSCVVRSYMVPICFWHVEAPAPIDPGPRP